MVTASVVEEQYAKPRVMPTLLTLLIMRKKFHIAVGPVQWRLDYVSRYQAELFGCLVYFRNYPRVLFGIANNAAFADFAAAYFKLRLDQHNQTTVCF